MRLTFRDLLIAKVALQMRAISPDIARGTLTCADHDELDALTELRNRGLVDQAQARRIARAAELGVFLKAESFYSGVLKQMVPLIDERTLADARRRQREGGNTRRIGELLIEAGQLTPLWDQKVLEAANAHLARDDAEAVERYRARRFAGIERPSLAISDVVRQSLAEPAPVPLPPIPPSPTSVGPRGTRVETTRFEHIQCMYPNPLAGTGLERRYIPERKLGAGGMGAVYLAWEVESGQPIALKLILDAERSPDAVARFKREILATAMVDHENVVHIWDAGPTADSAYFLAMEAVPGEELSATLERDGRITVEHTVALLGQILIGLGAIHDAGIAHRDIKPENIRVWVDEAGVEHVRIMDLGISHFLADTERFEDQVFHTTDGVTGSPAYMSPETVSGGEGDHRADFYALGVSLYEMLSGRLPFEPESADELLSMHIHKAPTPLRSHTPHVPEALARIVHRLMAKTPEERYERAGDIIAELNERVLPLLGMDRVDSSPRPATKGTIVVPKTHRHTLEKKATSVEATIRDAAAAEPEGLFSRLRSALGI